MKAKFLLPIAAALALSQFGCDVIDPPYKRDTGGGGGGGGNPDVVMRKVYVEDFTGYRCGNCPQGTKELDKLVEKFDTNLVAVAIHCGAQFASPQPTKKEYVKDQNGNNVDTVFFVTDFRVIPAGEQLYAKFLGNAGQPNGSVNRRKKSDSTYHYPFTAWSGESVTVSNQEAVCWIGLSVNYNAATQGMEAAADVQFVKNNDVNTKIALYVVEDSIIYPQVDKSSYQLVIRNYVHKHVFRGVISSGGAFGDVLTTAPVANKTSVKKSYQFNFSGKDWNINHCSVIAIVTNADTEEVLQAQQVKIIKR